MFMLKKQELITRRNSASKSSVKSRKFLESNFLSNLF